jgi:polar amino acid transport system substrate-binding protein
VNANSNYAVRAMMLLVVCALPGMAVRADQLDDIRHHGVLIIGVLGTDEPNSFVDPTTRQYVGYEVDLGNAIAQRLGVKASFTQLAVAARIPELQQGRVDILAATLTHTKEREALIDFSLTTLVTGQRVMVRSNGGITELAQLAGKKVVTAKGGTQEINIRKAVPSVDVVTFETAQQAFLAFRQGKGVGYVNDEVSLLSDYSKLGADQQHYVILPQSISTEPIAIGIRKGQTSLKAAIDDALRDMERSGEGAKLFVKWFGADSRLKIPTRSFKFDSDKIPD